jgi:hypothetical protein
MPYGIDVRNANGRLVLSDTYGNHTLEGPFTALDYSPGLSAYATVGMLANYYYDVPQLSNGKAPPCFLELPTCDETGYTIGVAIAGCSNLGNGFWRYYFIGINAGYPKLYYLREMKYKTADTNYGLNIYNAAGELNYTSKEHLARITKTDSSFPPTATAATTGSPPTANLQVFIYSLASPTTFYSDKVIVNAPFSIDCNFTRHTTSAYNVINETRCYGSLWAVREAYRYPWKGTQHTLFRIACGVIVGNGSRTYQIAYGVNFTSADWWTGYTTNSNNRQLIIVDKTT